MIDPERRQNAFEWVPIQDKPSRFPGPKPYHKPEYRKPRFWLKNAGGSLFFVNNTGHTLEEVRVAQGGFSTVDDDTVTYASPDRAYYGNVQPGEAVKIEEFDFYFDLDIVFQLTIRLKSEAHGCLEFKTPGEKGSIGECVLLWDTNEPGRGVDVNDFGE